jgi:hypothetical protein
MTTPLKEKIIYNRHLVPNFDKINKYTVVICSLRNQLKTSKNIDELIVLAGKIIGLEQKILIEKTAGYKKLQRARIRAEESILKLNHLLAISEEKLSYVNSIIEFKLNGYKKNLQSKIDILKDDYNSTIVLNNVEN